MEIDISKLTLIVGNGRYIHSNWQPQQLRITQDNQIGQLELLDFGFFNFVCLPCSQ